MTQALKHAWRSYGRNYDDIVLGAKYFSSKLKLLRVTFDAGPEACLAEARRHCDETVQGVQAGHINHAQISGQVILYQVAINSQILSTMSQQLS